MAYAREKRFIIECIRSYLGNNDSDKIRRLYNKSSFEKLTELIESQNIEGFFYHLYLNKHLDKIKIPDKTIDKWKKVSGKNLLINTLNDDETLTIVKEFNKRKIDYTYIKGLSTRKRCYENNYIKGSCDIDLFIKKNDYKKTKELLIENGYEIPYKYYNDDVDIAIPFKDYEKRAFEISFVKKKAKLKYSIDLHWDFFFTDKKTIFNDLYDKKTFFGLNKRNILRIDSKKINVFSLEDEFIYIAFHYVL